MLQLYLYYKGKNIQHKNMQHKNIQHKTIETSEKRTTKGRSLEVESSMLMSMVFNIKYTACFANFAIYYFIDTRDRHCI